MLLAGVAWGIANRDHLDSALIAGLIDDLGFWGPVGYILLYGVATVFFLPGALLGLAGGALFGPFWGTLWTLLGATFGATLAFLIARSLAGDWAARRAGGHLDALVSGVDAEGWRFVALVRLVSLVPFNLLNDALGPTRISTLPYVLASAAAMLPGVAVYSWLGHAGEAALAGKASALHMVLIGLGVLALLALATRLARRLHAGWPGTDALTGRPGAGQRRPNSRSMSESFSST